MAKTRKVTPPKASPSSAGIAKGPRSHPQNKLLKPVKQRTNYGKGR